MNSPLFFIFPALGLLVAFIGLGGAVWAVVGLWKAKAAQRSKCAAGAAPPVLSGAAQQERCSAGWWALCLKCLLGFSLAALALGVALLWSSGLSVWVESGPGREWSDGRAPQLEPLIRKHCAPLLRQGKTVGLAVALVTPTNATVMTFGRPALSSSAQTRPDTLFEIGSITKTFTGLTLARQIECGAVRLDQPIRELLPPAAVLPEAARGITLRHLTTHSSGFPRVAPNGSLMRAYGVLLFGSDPYGGYTVSDLLADVGAVKLESSPGTKGSYSNFGMSLLGYLLATNANSSYEALLKRQVCAPLGLNDTTIQLDPGQALRTAQGYRAVVRWGPLVLGVRSAPWLKHSDLGGAGGLWSSAADMLKYLQASLHPEGQPLERALQQAQQVLFQEDERTAYGMNWVHVQSQRLGQELVWHNGGTGGFRSFIGFTADRRFGVLLLSNSGEDVDDLAVALLRDLTVPPK